MKDSRITYLDFFGRQYPLCLTVQGHQQVEEAFGSLEEMSQALSGSGSEELTDWGRLLLILMEGGAARVKAVAWMDGQDPDPLPEIPSQDTLNQILSWGDIHAWGGTIMAAVGGSTQQTVEAESEKKQEATQESD